MIWWEEKGRWETKKFSMRKKKTTGISTAAGSVMRAKKIYKNAEEETCSRSQMYIQTIFLARIRLSFKLSCIILHGEFTIRSRVSFFCLFSVFRPGDAEPGSSDIPEAAATG